jgi:hypothetical protein
MKKDPSIASESLVAELEILVEGFLADTEPFVGSGLTTLYELGYIDQERWESLQPVKFESDVDTIENTFNEVASHETGDLLGTSMCYPSDNPEIKPLPALFRTRTRPSSRN